MSHPPRRRFDATWLPFGMMIGFVVGIGTGLAVIENLLVGAVIGVLVGAALGAVLGLRGGGRMVDDEDELDERYRREHGDPRPRGPEQ